MYIIYIYIVYFVVKMRTHVTTIIITILDNRILILVFWYLSLYLFLKILVQPLKIIREIISNEPLPLLQIKNEYLSKRHYTLENK